MLSTVAARYRSGWGSTEVLASVRATRCSLQVFTRQPRADGLPRMHHAPLLIAILQAFTESQTSQSGKAGSGAELSRPELKLRDRIGRHISHCEPGKVQRRNRTGSNIAALLHPSAPTVSSMCRVIRTPTARRNHIIACPIGRLALGSGGSATQLQTGYTIFAPPLSPSFRCWPAPRRERSAELSRQTFS